MRITSSEIEKYQKDLAKGKRKREGLCSNIKRISLNEESNGEN
jgi:hypothetical protein